MPNPLVFLHGLDLLCYLSPNPVLLLFKLLFLTIISFPKTVFQM